MRRDVAVLRTYLGKIVGCVVLFVLLGLLLILSLGIANLLYRNDALTSESHTTQLGSAWYLAYRPAVHTFLRGENPYGAHFYNPPWALIFVAPIAFVPPPFDYGLLIFVSFVTFGMVCYKLKFAPLSTVLCLLSYPVLAGIGAGQIEWLPALGLICPAWLGVIFLLIKPQVSIGILIYWTILRFRNGGVWSVFKLFAPSAVCLLLSFCVYGFWPYNIIGLVEREPFCWWPYSVVVGLYALYRAVSKRSISVAAIASVCLTPHAWIYALSLSTILSGKRLWFAVRVFCLSWMYLIIYYALFVV